MSKKLTYKEDAELLNYGIGLTNIVPRTTRAADELSRYVSSQSMYTAYILYNFIMAHKGVHVMSIIQAHRMCGFQMCDHNYSQRMTSLFMCQMW